jgi:hypothetical protein
MSFENLKFLENLQEQIPYLTNPENLPSTNIENLPDLTNPENLASTNIEKAGRLLAELGPNDTKSLVSSLNDLLARNLFKEKGIDFNRAFNNLKSKVA